MNLFITGGAGYVGYSLIHRILATDPNIKITVYDNLSRKNYALFFSKKIDQSRISFIEGEILDSRKLRKSIPGHDTVIHLAAKVTTPYADHDAHIFEQINHWGSSELAMAVEDSKDVKRMIYLSSLSVYGNHSTPINLNSELNPGSFYGISKLRGENQIIRLKNEKEIHILRSGNVYGFNPAIRLDAVINRFMFDANFNKQIAIQGSGEQHRAFIHVEKLAEIISQIVFGGVRPGINNLAEFNLSVNEIVKILRSIFAELEYIFVNQNIRMRDVIVDLEKIELLNLLKNPKNIREELEAFKNALAF